MRIVFKNLRSIQCGINGATLSIPCKCHHGGILFFFVLFFFLVVTNRHINLCIERCPPSVGMYCSDCLQQKRPNQNLSFRHISLERGPTHPFLCDVKSSFDLFIKPTLNSALSQKGSVVLIVFKKKRPNQNPLSARISRGRGPTHLYQCDIKANHHLAGCFCSMAATCMNLSP